MNFSSLCDVLVDQLKDLHSAETQLVKALPKIAERVSTASLKSAIENHLEETRNHVARLEQAGQLLDCKLTGKKCSGMEGLLEEGDEALHTKGNEAAIDAAVVAAAQRVEHYEMAAYGSARTIAEQIGKNDIANLLQQTLEEEKAADQKLTQVVQQDIYPQALRGNGGTSEHDGHSPSQQGQKAKRAVRH